MGSWLSVFNSPRALKLALERKFSLSPSPETISFVKLRFRNEMYAMMGEEVFVDVGFDLRDHDDGEFGYGQPLGLAGMHEY